MSRDGDTLITDYTKFNKSANIEGIKLLFSFVFKTNNEIIENECKKIDYSSINIYSKIEQKKAKKLSSLNRSLWTAIRHYVLSNPSFHPIENFSLFSFLIELVEPNTYQYKWLLICLSKSKNLIQPKFFRVQTLKSIVINWLMNNNNNKQEDTTDTDSDSELDSTFEQKNQRNIETLILYNNNNNNNNNNQRKKKKQEFQIQQQLKGLLPLDLITELDDVRNFVDTSKTMWIGHENFEYESLIRCLSSFLRILCNSPKHSDSFKSRSNIQNLLINLPSETVLSPLILLSMKELDLIPNQFLTLIEQKDWITARSSTLFHLSATSPYIYIYLPFFIESAQVSPTWTAPRTKKTYADALKSNPWLQQNQESLTQTLAVLQEKMNK